jgi:hypothetical protein
VINNKLGSTYKLNQQLYDDTKKMLAKGKNKKKKNRKGGIKVSPNLFSNHVYENSDFTNDGES